MTQFTKEEIFQMAQEAGGTFDHMMWLNRDLLPVFERFAEIVCVKQHKKKLVQMEDSWMVCREKIAEFERKIKEDRYMLGSNVTAPVQQVGTIGHIGNGPTTLTAAIAPLLAEQPAQQERWAVFCGICRKEWSVPYQHPGKSVCENCEAAHGITGSKT